MTLKQIEYFQMVCEKGNITTAAEALFVSRSVVSRTIADIEETFGAPVFTRSKSGVVLTEYGKIVSRLFSTFTNNYAAAQHRIDQLKQSASPRTLSIGVTPTNIYAVYMNYLDHFSKCHPDIQVKVQEHSAHDVLKLVDDGTLDVAFTPAHPDEDIFIYTDLYKNPIMLGMAADDPLASKKTISLADILDLPLAFFNAPMPIEDKLKTCFQALDKEPDIVLRTTDLLLLQELTRRHEIYSMLPRDMMISWHGTHQVPLDFIRPSINRLVWSRVLSCSDTLDTFLNFMEI